MQRIDANCKRYPDEYNTWPFGNNGGNCYESGGSGHFRRNCPKLRNMGGTAHGRAFVIGNKEAIQDPLVVTGTFLINHLYATVLFDSGADKSFITTTFKELLNHETKKLDVAYEVEVENGQIESMT